MTNKCIAITIGVLSLGLVDVTAALIIVTTAGIENYQNSNQVITIGKLDQKFNESDANGMVLAIIASLAGVVVMVLLEILKHGVDGKRHNAHAEKAMATMQSLDNGITDVRCNTKHWFYSKILEIEDIMDIELLKLSLLENLDTNI